MWFVRLIPVAVFAAFALAIGVWFAAGRSADDAMLRVPGTDNRTQEQDAPGAADLAGEFVRGDGKAGNDDGLWPNFRGSTYDGISPEQGGWTAPGPAKLWEIPLGEGYAGPAVRDGRVYLLDYDATKRADVLRCIALGDGKEIWHRAYQVDVKRNHGMSRTVPAVGDRYAVALGPKCHVLCVDRKTGDYKWGMDLMRQYRTKVPPWYAGQCPLIDNGRAIIAPGGSALMIAVDCETGKVAWETPNPRGWDMTHTSIIPMEFGGVHMYIYAGSGGVAGVDAQTGKLLWETTAWKVKIAAVPSPVPLGDGRILLTGGYDAGSMMVRLMPSGNGFNLETLWTDKPDVFGAEQQTPVFYKGNIYGVIPGGQLVCLDPETGKQKWNSGKNRFGIGPYLIAGGVMYVTSDTGTLSVIPADPQEFHLMGSADVIPKGHECWGPMALASGKLLVRDLTRMVCLDLTKAAQ